MTQAFRPQGITDWRPPRATTSPRATRMAQRLTRDRGLGGALGFADLPRFNRGTEAALVLTGELGILRTPLGH